MYGGEWDVCVCVCVCVSHVPEKGDDPASSNIAAFFTSSLSCVSWGPLPGGGGMRVPVTHTHTRTHTHIHTDDTVCTEIVSSAQLGCGQPAAVYDLGECETR